MVAKRVEVEFFGGPADGLRLCAREWPRSDLLLPVGAPTWRVSDATVRLDARSALYRSRTEGSQLECEATTPLRYQFVGIRRPDSNDWQRSLTTRCRRALGVRLPSRWPASALARLKTWMLAPIDYPLRVVRSNIPQARQAAGQACFSVELAGRVRRVSG